MIRKPLFLLTFIISLLVFAGVGGVYASWNYAKDPIRADILQANIGMSEFIWTGSETLPDSVEGEDHTWLIFNLVEGENASGAEIGLNNPNSKLNDYIDKRDNYNRDYFGSMAVTGGEDVENLFGTKAAGLTFIIQKVSNVEYYIYTTSVYLGERGEINALGLGNKTPGKPSIPLGEQIYPIYKTKLTRPNANADWDIIETVRGSAPSAWYDENRRLAPNATQIPSFDISNWKAAEFGRADTPIWTFVGDNPVAYAISTMEIVHYRLQPKTTGVINVSIDNPECEITIYSASPFNESTKIVSYSPSNNLNSDKASVSFNATSGQNYYIAVTGDDVMNLIIT